MRVRRRQGCFPLVVPLHLIPPCGSSTHPLSTLYIQIPFSTTWFTLYVWHLAHVLCGVGRTASFSQRCCIGFGG